MMATPMGCVMMGFWMSCLLRFGWVASWTGCALGCVGIYLIWGLSSIQIRDAWGEVKEVGDT